MSEFKPTPGEWKIEYDNCDYGTSQWYKVGPAKVEASYQISTDDEAEWKSNASLIQDAGNTYHATGMTPSQLAERVKVLEDALRLIASTDVIDAALDPQRAVRVAKKTLAK